MDRTRGSFRRIDAFPRELLATLSRCAAVSCFYLTGKSVRSARAESVLVEGLTPLDLTYLVAKFGDEGAGSLLQRVLSGLRGLRIIPARWLFDSRGRRRARTLCFVLP